MFSTLNSYSLEESKICCLEKGLAFTRQQSPGLSKLKAVRDHNFIVAQIVQFLLERLKNIVGKENSVYQLFLLFP